MTLERFEVGIVSRDRGVVDFLAEVFQLAELPETDYGVGIVHRLQSPGAVIKVMVPKESPAEAQKQPFLAVTGLRYLTMAVTDMDAAIERAVARGGTVVFAPFELTPGSRLAIIEDPDGNTIELTDTNGTSASPEADR